MSFKVEDNIVFCPEKVARDTLGGPFANAIRAAAADSTVFRIYETIAIDSDFWTYKVRLAKHEEPTELAKLIEEGVWSDHLWVSASTALGPVTAECTCKAIDLLKGPCDCGWLKSQGGSKYV